MAIQPGSKVRCVKKSGWNKIIPSITIPVLDKSYTVRGIYVAEGYEDGIYLEEIVNSPLPLTGIEPSFNVSEFEEIQDEKNAAKEIAKLELYLN